MAKNLSIWDALEATDSTYTKNFNRAGFRGSAINPTYTAKKLTELFGPCGQGWRFVLEDEQYVEGHTLTDTDKSIIHVVRGHLDYKPDPKGEFVSTGPQYGHTVFVGKNKNGVFTDDECQKKSITDCIGKCAVLLGCSADVYLGLFDDSKYINDATKGTDAGSKGSGVSRTSTKAPKRKTASGKVGAQTGKPVKRKPAKKAPVKKKSAAKRKVAAKSSELPKTAVKRWVPAQFAEWIADASSPEDLHARYCAIRATGKGKAAETLAACIEAVSTTMREKVEKGTPVWNTLTEFLTDDKKAVDAAK